MQGGGGGNDDCAKGYLLKDEVEMKWHRKGLSIYFSLRRIGGGKCTKELGSKTVNESYLSQFGSNCFDEGGERTKRLLSLGKLRRSVGDCRHGYCESPLSLRMPHPHIRCF